nr:two component sensor kinase [Cyanidiaceae sp.]
MRKFHNLYIDTNVGLQFKIINLLVFIISLLISSSIFLFINGLNNNATLIKEKSIHDILDLISSNFNLNIEALVLQRKQLIFFCQTFYRNITEFESLVVFNQEGVLYCAQSFKNKSVNKFEDNFQIVYLNLLRRMFNLNIHFPLIYTNLDGHGQYFTQALVTLNRTNYDETVLFIEADFASKFPYWPIQLFFAVFLMTWFIAVLGGILNSLVIVRPVKELLVGIKNIATGNFEQRIYLSFEGQIGELIASFNNMSERLKNYDKESKEELTSEKAKAEILVSTIADGAILLNEKLEIILINEKAKEIFNCEFLDLLGARIDKLLPQNLQPLVMLSLKNLVKAKEIDSLPVVLSNLNLVFLARSRKKIKIFLNQALSQSNSKVLGISLIVRDVTQEIELSLAKNYFISNISHELRTPLFNIKSFVETLEDYDRILTRKQKLSFLNTIHKEADRLTRLVDNVLSLSTIKPRRNNNLNAFYLFKLRILIYDTILSYQIKLQNKKISTYVELEDNLSEIFANYDLLFQAVSNLISNAIKFSYIGGLIAIRVFTLNKKKINSLAIVRVEISDSGIGIDMSRSSEVFERFSRIDNKFCTLQGTGIGLFLAKNIVEQHHSYILMHSQLSCGSTFFFDLTF